MHFLAFACECTEAERQPYHESASKRRSYIRLPSCGTVLRVKSVAWSLLGFCVVVSAVASVHLLSPDVQDSPAALAGASRAAVGAAAGAGAQEAATGGVLSSLTPTGWADAIVALLFAAVAFGCGSYLTARAARDADDASADLPVADFA
jgi:hypothetical protein